MGNGGEKQKGKDWMLKLGGFVNNLKKSMIHRRGQLICIPTNKEDFMLNTAINSLGRDELSKVEIQSLVAMTSANACCSCMVSMLKASVHTG